MAQAGIGRRHFRFPPARIRAVRSSRAPSAHTNRTNCQKWTVTPWGDGFFRLLKVNSRKALDVKDISTADGAAIQHWSCWTGSRNRAAD